LVLREHCKDFTRQSKLNGTLGLEVTLQEHEDQVLAAYDCYTSQWVSTVPWPERQKIRLSYNIL